MRLSKYLKTKRENKGFTMRALAKKSGLTATYISQIEREDVKNPPSEDALLKLSEALNLSITEKKEILHLANIERTPISIIKEFDTKTEELKQKLSLLQKQINDHNSNINLSNALDLHYKIPVYKSVSAGAGCDVEYGELIEYVNIPEMRNGSEVFGVVVDGDSMEYTIPNKSTIIVKKDIEVSDNEIGVFVVNNESFVKRFRKNNNIIMLLSDNRTYDPIVITEHDEFYMVGKVVKVMYDL